MFSMPPDLLVKAEQLAQERKHRSDSIYALASRAKPKVFELSHKVKNPAKPEFDMHFCTFGCQGNAKENQIRVAAEMMEYWLNNPTKTPDFVLILGDNFYDSGVDSIDDPIFKSHFEDIYARFKELKIPCFTILGNHDENLHLMKLPGSESGIDRGLHQIAYSYRNVYKPVTIDKHSGYPRIYKPGDKPEPNPYEKNQLVLEDLPLWNMPSQAYALKCGDTQLFCIDSNAYVKDYLEYLEDLENGRTTRPGNQAKWLAEEMEKATALGLKVMLATHHGPATTGKRAYQDDLSIYLDSDELQKIKNKLGINNNEPLSYNYLLKHVLQKQNLIFDSIFAAHDHNMFYYNNKNNLKEGEYPICQITSGGGGGDLQSRLQFIDQLFMGYFLKSHGFTEVQANKQTIIFNIHPLNKAYHLEFTSDSCEPIRRYRAQIATDEQEKIEKLCKVVKDALNDYLIEFLGHRQEVEKGKFMSMNPLYGNISHGQKGVDRAHDLWAYISNAEADDYETTLKTIYKMAQWKGFNYGFGITQPSENSLISLLNKKIAVEYEGKNLENLCFPNSSPEESSGCTIS